MDAALLVSEYNLRARSICNDALEVCIDAVVGGCARPHELILVLGELMPKHQLVLVKQRIVVKRVCSGDLLVSLGQPRLNLPLLVNFKLSVELKRDLCRVW